ncbi:hypothetical protein J7E96_12935 [Streptomyces sp. ISL-96]|uniref:hypothetical protein n=1 Tax=Streptomyces sp. ISL-96 TaxID=2819191 RepID=UPI001BE68C7A|nr:hypothetical protein [Streptomyces sp. ISL-96]MBT2489410.1 hypothetical protein [Streptomyces sp. ISL-96]
MSRLGALCAAVLCAGLLSACGGSEKKADLADQDRFLREYVNLLNKADEDGLAGLLDDHPHGKEDAHARIAAYGGQEWDVTWNRTSDFPDVWKVRLTGTAGADRRPVKVVETVSWEDEHWLLTPLDGVVTKPPNAADTTPPG